MRKMQETNPPRQFGHPLILMRIRGSMRLLRRRHQRDENRRARETMPYKETVGYAGRVAVQV